MSPLFQRSFGIRFVKSKSPSAEESVTKRENLVLCRVCFSVTAAAGKCEKQAQVAADISADTTTASAKTIAPRITSIVGLLRESFLRIYKKCVSLPKTKRLQQQNFSDEKERILTFRTFPIPSV